MSVDRPRGNNDWLTLAIGKEGSVRLWCKEKGKLWKAQPRNSEIKWVRVELMDTSQKLQADNYNPNKLKKPNDPITS